MTEIRIDKYIEHNIDGEGNRTNDSLKQKLGNL